VAGAAPPAQTEFGEDTGAGEDGGAAGGGTGGETEGPTSTGAATSPVQSEAEYVFFFGTADLCATGDAVAVKAVANPMAKTPTNTPWVTRELMTSRAPTFWPRSTRMRLRSVLLAKAVDTMVRTRATALITGTALHQLCRPGALGARPHDIDRPLPASALHDEMDNESLLLNL
jgi:hypothetical protein